MNKPARDEATNARPTTGRFEVATTTDAAELSTFCGIVSRSFFLGDRDSEAWMAHEGRDNVRVVRRGGRLAGGLTLRPMGQWFGGRSVPTTGIRCVVVAPEDRGGGAAGALMRATVRELHERGVALSTLYPSTQPLYRSAGYERAGVRLMHRLPLANLGALDRTPTLRPIAPDDHPAVKQAYDARAMSSPGNLDRDAFIWSRVIDPPAWMPRAKGYLVEGDGAVEGYIVYAQAERGRVNHAHDLEVLDLVARTPGAARRLLTFLSDHGSMCETALWFGAPADPLMFLLPDHHYVIAQRMDWMLRVIDVVRALESRGYPPGLTATVNFDVVDDLLPENQGRFVLDVADGCGQVTRGGTGDVRIDVRGLAPLYTGHLSGFQLKSCGYVEADGEALRTVSAVFAGPAPWMPDMF